MQKGKMLSFVTGIASYFVPLQYFPLRTDVLTRTTHPKFGVPSLGLTGETLAMLHEGPISSAPNITEIVERCEEFGSEKILVLPGENPTGDITANVKSRLIPQLLSLQTGINGSYEWHETTAAVAAVKDINVASITGLAGKILRVGAKTYVFVAADPAGDEILIGADAAETEDNIKDKIQADSLYTRCTAAINTNKVRCTATTAGTDFLVTTDAPSLLTITTVTANVESVGYTDIQEWYDPAYVPPDLGMYIVGIDQNDNVMSDFYPKVNIPKPLQRAFKFGQVIKGDVQLQASLEATRPDGTYVTYFRKTVAPFNVSVF